MADRIYGKGFKLALRPLLGDGLTLHTFLQLSLPAAGEGVDNADKDDTCCGQGWPYVNNLYFCFHNICLLGGCCTRSLVTESAQPFVL